MTVRLITKRQLTAMVGVSYPTIWRWMRAGKFPQGLAVGSLTRWRSDEIDEWLAELPLREAQDAKNAELQAKQQAKRDAYHRQKGAAKYRGIEWQFTFDAWVRWWEKQLGSNWMERRGCHSEEYVMARYADRGPYREDNVECITAGQNISERRRPRANAELTKRSKSDETK